MVVLIFIQLCGVLGYKCYLPPLKWPENEAERSACKVAPLDSIKLPKKILAFSNTVYYNVSMKADMEIIRVYIKRETKQEVLALAKISHRSLSSEVVLAVEEYLKRHKKERTQE